MKIGDRVGAILSADNKNVHFLGFGVYQGDTVPDPLILGSSFPFENPTIKLDSGEIVYGVECWWGPEAEVQQQIKGRLIIHTDIRRVRNGETNG